MALRILVADDASFIRDMVKKQLREGLPGVEVVEATDGSRALAALKQQSVDLILSDWEMPNMGGEELLQQLREQPEHEEVPFVMVTSRGDRAYVVKAAQAGVSDYLVKPFTGEELMRKVLRQLKKAGKSPKTNAKAGSGGFAAESVGILTGGRSAEATKSAPEPAAEPGRSRKVKGRAQLRLGNRGETLRCALREMSLESLTGLIERSEGLPRLFDSVVVEVESDEAPPQLNGYVHSLQAAEKDPETRFVRLVIRLVDADGDKRDALIRYLDRS